MAKSSSVGGTGNGRANNKSAAIREVLDQNPKASSKEITAQLAAKGMKVAPTLIYYVKSKHKRAIVKAKRARAVEASRGGMSGNPVQVLLRVKDLAREVGGIRHLKQLVDVLAE
jgi:hypothetical protein